VDGFDRLPARGEREQRGRELRRAGGGVGRRGGGEPCRAPVGAPRLQGRDGGGRAGQQVVALGCEAEAEPSSA
jgi:hypothetical protein